MNREQLQKARRIFLEARELSPEDRESYVARACGDDERLRREVDVLLEHDQQPARILQPGGLSLGLDRGFRESLKEFRRKAQPRSIGPYRIVRLLGEGGMGTVYEAVQESTGREVALKVVRGPLLNEQQVRLFRREVRTLALLKHPNIAAIYDAGRTDEGRHYFVMELVRGQPLDEYLRARRMQRMDRAELSLRLQLFQQICKAIEHAHHRGVIHRDLKPVNIMVVSGDNEVSPVDLRIKVLDFGLARLTDADISMATMISEFTQIQGTLAYMSPEQARGNPDAIDLRSDIYSLGVILYELLTGQRPYDVNRVMIHQAVQVICEEAPTRPSRLLRILKGDLETIVLKTLEKEPARRYQSVTSLTEDILRYFQDQPIMARPPSATYQLRKLVRRHKGPFALAVILVAFLIGFGITMSVLLQGQRRERARAEAAAAKAEQINLFLQEMLGAAQPLAMGRDVTVREVLEAAAQDIQTSFANQPDVRAALQTTMGEAYRALGHYEAAESHLRSALAAYDAISGSGSAEVAAGRLTLSHLLSLDGDYEEAQELATEALERYRALAGEESPEVAACYSRLGRIHQLRGHYARAETLYADALRIDRALHGRESGVVATDMQNLAGALQRQSQFRQAESLLREALAIEEACADGENLNRSKIAIHLADVLTTLGDHAEAESLYREGIAIQTEVLGEDHPEVGIAIGNLGLLCKTAGRYAEAESLYRAALAIKRRRLEPHHPTLASTLGNLAVVLKKQGHFAEAESMQCQAEEILRSAHGDEHPYLVSSLYKRAELNQLQDRPDRADSLYRASLAMGRKLLGDEHSRTVVAKSKYARFLHERGEHAGAESLYREALASARRNRGAGHPGVASMLERLGSLLLECDRPSEAEPILRESVEIMRACYGTKDWRTAWGENLLGTCVFARGRTAEAESLLTTHQQQLAGSPAQLEMKRVALQHLVDFFRSTGRSDSAAVYARRLEALGW